MNFTQISRILSIALIAFIDMQAATKSVALPVSPVYLQEIPKESLGCGSIESFCGESEAEKNFRTFFSHQGSDSIDKLVCASDGTVYATCFDNRKLISVWKESDLDKAKFDLQKKLFFKNDVRSIAYCEAARLLATASGNQVHLWDADSRLKQKGEIQNESKVTLLALSPSGKRLAVCLARCLRDDRSVYRKKSGKRKTVIFDILGSQENPNIKRIATFKASEVIKTVGLAFSPNEQFLFLATLYGRLEPEHLPDLRILEIDGPKRDPYCSTYAEVDNISDYTKEPCFYGVKATKNNEITLVGAQRTVHCKISIRSLATLCRLIIKRLGKKVPKDCELSESLDDMLKRVPKPVERFVKISDDSDAVDLADQGSSSTAASSSTEASSSTQSQKQVLENKALSSTREHFQAASGRTTGPTRRKNLDNLSMDDLITFVYGWNDRRVCTPNNMGMM